MSDVTVVAKPHPLRPDVVYTQFQHGQTLLEMVGNGASHSCVISVGGYQVPRELWGKLRPKAGQTISVDLYPQGGGSGSKWLRIIAMAVLTVVTSGIATAGWFAGAAAAVGVASTLAAIVGLVGTLLINALIPPAMPGMPGAQDPFEQANSLTGTSNRAAPYAVIPCVVGTMTFFPPHAALPYTEVVGEDQYLRMMLDLGYGHVNVSDIEIGGTAIANYDDVEYEVTDTPTLYTNDIFEASVAAALADGDPAIIRTTQGNTSEISLDILFGRGLFGVSDKGDTITATCTFDIDYSPAGAGTWVPVTAASGLSYSGGMRSSSGNVVVSSGERKTLRAGLRFKVPAGSYDIRVKRISTSFPGASANGQIGDATWTVLRSISAQSPSTTGTTKLCVRIRATDQLNGVVQNLSCRVEQKIRTYDSVSDAWLAPSATQNPAWIYHWLLTTCPAVERHVADDRMDLASIEAWAADCEAMGYVTSFVMDSGRALGDILRDVLAAGRGSYGTRNGRHSVVRDIEQTIPVQMFTTANSWDYSYGRSFAAPPHALKVKFTNPQANNQQDERVVYADGYSAGTATRFESLDLRMVPDPAAVWRLAKYHLSVIYNRAMQHTFQADIEHMVCERGDLIMHAHELTGWGVATGRIRSVTATTVTLDGPVTLEAATSYKLQVRKSDGTQETVSITDAAGTYTTLTTTTTADPGDLFAIGEVNKVTAPLVVRKIEPSSDMSATLTCVDAAPAVWTAGTGTPPLFVSSITGTSWCNAPDEPTVHIRLGDSPPDDGGVGDPVVGVGNGGNRGGIFRMPIFRFEK